MAQEILKLHYDVHPDDFSVAGEASTNVKKVLKQLGFSPGIIRKVAVAMYECEINMVIHADGGEIDVEISPDKIRMVHSDRGPGIKDVEKAMEKGYSTADESAREMGFGAGMGLPNMERYTDEMHITTEIGKGTVVDMTVYVR